MYGLTCAGVSPACDCVLDCVLFQRMSRVGSPCLASLVHLPAACRSISADNCRVVLISLHMSSASLGGISRLKLPPPPAGNGGFMPAVGHGQPVGRPRWPPIANTLPNEAPDTRAADGKKQNQWAVVVWAPFPAAPWGHAGPVPLPAAVGPFPPTGPQGLLVEGVHTCWIRCFQKCA